MDLVEALQKYFKLNCKLLLSHRQKEKTNQNLCKHVQDFELKWRLL